MTGSASQRSPLRAADEKKIRQLISYLDSSVPSAYRGALFAYLLPRVLEPDTRISRGPGPSRRTPFELSGYASLFAPRGQTLLKALGVLKLGESQAGVRWMTPAEIAELLKDIGARSVFRSNISHALRKDSRHVARRRRGRGYEYALTHRGRERVEGELRLIGAA